MSLRYSICYSCKHFMGSGDNHEPKCAAFPEIIERDNEWIPSAIPPSIFSGRFDHTKPYPGDNGIRYEPKE
ncbi:MAG: hypothetical protein PUG48_10625 [Clostridia bacterium]|nr:hypothetical protein [Clostridia bacterium]